MRLNTVIHKLPELLAILLLFAVAVVSPTQMLVLVVVVMVFLVIHPAMRPTKSSWMAFFGALMAALWLAMVLTALRSQSGGG